MQRLGSRNAWLDDGSMLCIIHGGFWKNFYDFLRAGLDSAPELDSRPAVHCRPRQWHVPCLVFLPVLMHFALCSHDCPQLMLRLLTSCTWKSVHYFQRAPCIFQHFPRSKFCASRFFWSPRAPTGVSVRGLGVGADAGSFLSSVGPPDVHN